MPHYQNEAFGRLLRGAVNAIASFEGKAAARVEQELGELIKMAPATIQRYKTGWVPDNPAIIEALAEACVRRALLARPWLQRFLQAARYYDAPSLIERLMGQEAEKPPPANAHNLPAPTFGQFVMRPGPLQDVADGLNQRTAAVAVVSMGGMGKTSLALEVAARCLQQPRAQPEAEGPQPPPMQAAIWISDKDRPSSTTLLSVLDEIALTLGYPGYTQFEPARKQREVELLLKQQRVLVVVDNLETVSDQALIRWLMRLPEPSKALITTREFRPEFQQGAWVVELRGMEAHESDQLILNRARQIGMRPPPDAETRRELGQRAGGNPRAIELLLGLMKRSGQSAREVIDLWVAAQGERAGGADHALTELFVAGWASLDGEARQVLLAATLFPTAVSRAALKEVAAASEAGLFQATQQLADLALLEIEHGQGEPGREGPRYSLHPLTRHFVEAQHSSYEPFLAAARERWLAWGVARATAFGYLHDDISRLQQLDGEELSLAAVLAWAFGQGRFAETIQLVKGLEFYYYVRARWNRKIELHEQYLAAARALRDGEEQILALTMHIQLLCRQGRPQLAAPFIAQLDEVAAAGPVDGTLAFHLHHSRGLYALAAGEFEAASAAWQQILDRGEAWALPDHMLIGARHWLAVCLYQQGRYAEAYACYQRALDEAQAHGYQRMVARNQLHLALVDLAGGELESAARRLQASEAQTEGRDWEQRARLHMAYARLREQQGDPIAAEEARQAAADLLRRSGIAGYDRQLVV
jgi:tetratricopeptide (TPR) repeat protein